jgi:hypothetical protein
MKDPHPASQDPLKYGDRHNGTEMKSFCSLEDAETKLRSPLAELICQSNLRHFLYLSRVASA